MKRKIFLLSVVAICIAIAAVGTLAYFNAEDTAHNVITSGSVKIRLDEWADQGCTQPFEDQTGVMPGTAATKIVEVANTGKSPAWVRVSVAVSVTAADGETPLPSAPVELDFNKQDWTDGGDGFYYYNSPLAPGESTAPLFTQVSFHNTMGNEYQNSAAKIDVSAEAVQTAHNGETPLDAKGWPSAPAATTAATSAPETSGEPTGSLQPPVTNN